MTVTKSTPTPQGRMWPAWISSIVGYLPSVFSRESSSTATGAGATNSAGKGEAPAKDGSRAEHEAHEAHEVKKDSSATAVSESGLCHDTPSHPESERRIELSSKVRSMLRKALPDKEKVSAKSLSSNHILTTPRSCVACDEQVRTTKLITAPCGHIYCHRCLCKMAVLALQDMQQFPVRCCSQEIPAVRVGCVMDARGRRLYISRVDELAVPPAERRYCPQTTCGRWIPPKDIEKNSKTQKCPHCRAVICTSCHDLAHENTECTEDPGLRQLLNIARRQHWQRCYNCHALVWKIDGCNHMSCVCRAQFCYICGRQWGGCHCRNSTGPLDNVGQIAGGDLDTATVVAAMDFAEQDETEVMHYEQWYTGPAPFAERLQEQRQQSQPPRAQPAIHARATPSTRPERPARPAAPTPATSARMAPARTTPARTTPARTTPGPVRHTQPRPGVLQNEAAQTQQYAWRANRAIFQVQLNQVEIERILIQLDMAILALEGQRGQL